MEVKNMFELIQSELKTKSSKCLKIYLKLPTNVFTCSGVHVIVSGSANHCTKRYDAEKFSVVNQRSTWMMKNSNRWNFVLNFPTWIAEKRNFHQNFRRQFSFLTQHKRLFPNHRPYKCDFSRCLVVFLCTFRLKLTGRNLAADHLDTRAHQRKETETIGTVWQNPIR